MVVALLLAWCHITLAVRTHVYSTHHLLHHFLQLFYIIGIELSGVVVATCIQPAIPVFTGAKLQVVLSRVATL